jgi:hypothetical protein
MKLHLIPAGKNYSNLHIEDDGGLSLSEKPHKADGITSAQFIIITDDSDKTIGDEVLTLNSSIIKTVTKSECDIDKNCLEVNGFNAILKSSCHKIISSNSPELTPNHLISDKDLKYIVDYWNKNKEMPEGEIMTDEFYSKKRFIEGKDAVTHDLMTTNNEVAIKYNAEETLDYLNKVWGDDKDGIYKKSYNATIKSVTNCPTCGSEVGIKNENGEHSYVPKKTYTDDEVLQLLLKAKQATYDNLYGWFNEHKKK